MLFYAHKPEIGVHRLYHEGDAVRYVAFEEECEEECECEDDHVHMKLMDDYLWQERIYTTKRTKRFPSVEAGLAEYQAFVNKQYKLK